jgi:hypothetical protein
MRLTFIEHRLSRAYKLTHVGNGRFVLSKTDGQAGVCGCHGFSATLSGYAVRTRFSLDVGGGSLAKYG